MSKAYISAALRREVIDRANGCCEYCLSNTDDRPIRLLTFQTILELAFCSVLFYDCLVGASGLDALTLPIPAPYQPPKTSRMANMAAADLQTSLPRLPPSP